MNSSDSVSLEGFEVFRDEIFNRAQVSSLKSKSKLENLVLEKWRTLSLQQRLKYAQTSKTFLKRKSEAETSSLSPSKKLKLDAIAIKQEPNIVNAVDKSEVVRKPPVPLNAPVENVIVNETLVNANAQVENIVGIGSETPVTTNAEVEKQVLSVEDNDRSVEYDEILSSGCHICKVKFKSVHNYPRHTKGKHSLVFISCKKCKTFYPQNSFKEHNCLKENSLQSSQNPGILKNISNQVNLALNKTQENNLNKEASETNDKVEASQSGPSNLNNSGRSNRVNVTKETNLNKSAKINRVNVDKENVEKVWPDYLDAKSLKTHGCPECKLIIKSGKYSLHLMDTHKVQYKFVMNSKDGKVDPKYVLINKANKPISDPDGSPVSIKTEPADPKSDFLKTPSLPQSNSVIVKTTNPVAPKKSSSVKTNLSSDILKSIKNNLSSDILKTIEPVQSNLGYQIPQTKSITTAVKNETMDVQLLTSNDTLKARITNENKKNGNNFDGKILNNESQSKSTILDASLPNSKKNRKNMKSKENIQVLQETLNQKRDMNEDEQISIVQENLLIQEEQIRTVIFQTETLPMDVEESGEADPLCDTAENLGNLENKTALIHIESTENGSVLNPKDFISMKIPVLIDKLKSEIRELLQEAKKRCLENPLVLAVEEDKVDNSNNTEEGGGQEIETLSEECDDEGNQSSVNNAEFNEDNQMSVSDAECNEENESSVNNDECKEDNQASLNNSELVLEDAVEDSEIQEDHESREFEQVEENSINCLTFDEVNKDHEDIEPTLDMEVTVENDDHQEGFNNYKRVLSGRSSFSSVSTLQPSKFILQKPMINFAPSSDNEKLQESDLNSYKMIMSGKKTPANKSDFESSVSNSEETSSSKIEEEEPASNSIAEEENSSQLMKINSPSLKNEVSVIKTNLKEKTEDNNNNTNTTKTKKRNTRINNNKSKISKKPSENQNNLNSAVSDVITYTLTPSEAVVKYKVTHSSLWMELVTNQEDKLAMAKVGMVVEDEKKVVAAWKDLVRGLSGTQMMERCEDNTKEVIEYAKFVCEEAGKEKGEVGETWWLAFRKKHDLLWRKS